MLLRPAYLSQKLDRPLPTKDGGTLRTIGEGGRLHDRPRQETRAAEPLAAGRQARPRARRERGREMAYRLK
jgi:hypothetical protein